MARAPLRVRTLAVTLTLGCALTSGCAGGSDGSPNNAVSSGVGGADASGTNGGLVESSGTSSTGLGGGAATTGAPSTVTTGLATSGTLGGSTSGGGSGFGGANAASVGGAGGATSALTTSDGTVGAGGALGQGGTAAGGASAGGSSAGGASAGGAGGMGGVGGGGAYNPCPSASGSECVVLPLGDSITEGCCTSPYGGYRIELFRQAFTNQKGITFVGSLSNGPNTVDGQTFPRAHEGHGGYTIDSDAGHSGISGMITQDALSNYQPQIVLLMIGTNDINGNVDINNAPNRLGNLLDDITTRAPDALVVVSSIIPTQNDGTNQAVVAYNAAMQTLVDQLATAGEHVVFLDNYSEFADNPNYKTALMADGLHPNDAGYAVLGQAFYGVIGDLLPPAQ